jgi:DegV family protein with EDD domain
MIVMGKTVFFADATCDIPKEFIEKNNIQIIGLRWTVTDKSGASEDGLHTIADDKMIKDFYKKLRDGKTPKTSLVTYQDAEAAFEPFFRNGYDIVHLGLSSGLALTYQNALNAGTDLSQKYGRKFFAPDTKLVSGVHLLVLKRMLEINDFDRIVQEIEDYYSKLKEYFTVDSLSYLHRGGRLSATAAVVGGVLNIKPLLKVNAEGKLENFAKAVGRNKSLQVLADFTKNINPQNPEVVIIHADCYDDAKLLEQKVKMITPNASVEIVNLGIIIGTHTGPGTLGITFRAK